MTMPWRHRQEPQGNLKMNIKQATQESWAKRKKQATIDALAVLQLSAAWPNNLGTLAAYKEYLTALQANTKA